MFQALVAASIHSQQSSTIRVADNSSSGTYAEMLAQVINACPSDQFVIVEAKNDGGAVGNLNALFNNEADAAFMHSDVFAFNAQQDPVNYSQFKTLVALWPEQIHVLALRNSKTRKYGIKTVDINSLADTAGYNVGAAGGGVITATVLKGPGRYNVVSFNTGGEVIAALDRGDIAAAIFVGAAPLPNLKKLPRDTYKLVPVGDSITGSASANFYRQSKINYPNLTTGPVATLAPLATLITKPFRTAGKVNAQRALRACFNNKLADLQDNGSPNWQSVTANDQGTLNNYLDLPASKQR
jgi:TRAP-type uncharacterized transport system substrate-binding protein